MGRCSPNFPRRLRRADGRDLDRSCCSTSRAASHACCSTPQTKAAARSSRRHSTHQTIAHRDRRQPQKPSRARCAGPEIGLDQHRTPPHSHHRSRRPGESAPSSERDQKSQPPRVTGRLSTPRIVFLVLIVLRVERNPDEPAGPVFAGHAGFDSNSRFAHPFATAATSPCVRKCALAGRMAGDSRRRNRRSLRISDAR